MGDSITLFMQHRNLVEVVKTYGELRQRVKEIAPDHLTSHEGVVTTALTEAQRAKLMPYEIELDSLIANIRSMLPPLIKMARAVTFGIGPAMREHFGDSDFPQFAPKETK
ncbi:hypothetical protein EN932_14060 [Mesorhizobium sp. M7A.F.Ca.US.002.01.1.1]|uniref:hypothetical protein n=1 Tax=Mesorhizobium sp. M7A.F.Ca.US.002.01.1.1 TaxID=2496700 RepID=UPI000FD60805|nr:hypothetical protein [Mesorhizobium sp. M7A.F.Ca.US.002.01.1.1]RVA11948.1 hypothetical protein EN932_14060 [Mesorhizobium sp. M7A.F.Ca.US.002.01.1.1]